MSSFSCLLKSGSAGTSSDCQSYENPLRPCVCMPFGCASMRTPPVRVGGSPVAGGARRCQRLGSYDCARCYPLVVGPFCTSVSRIRNGKPNAFGGSSHKCSQKSKDISRPFGRYWLVTVSLRDNASTVTATCRHPPRPNPVSQPPQALPHSACQTMWIRV